jgi:hypothetical protein
MSLRARLAALLPQPAPAARACGVCRAFEADPARIEAAFPGLSAMSSGYASVRADDGLCARLGRYLPASATCAAFAPRPDGARKT